MSDLNRTLRLSPEETAACLARLPPLPKDAWCLADCLDRVCQADVFEILPRLPPGFADLVVADPPYDLAKTFGSRRFVAMGSEAYEAWLETWVPALRDCLKPGGSCYVCGDWRSSAALQRVLERHFTVRNRITWEREKGRGSLRNWKNASEDIWFCTKGDDYVFNANQVRLRRAVVAPYRKDGQTRDWVEGEIPYRDTMPSNLWTDCTVPFWSMPENTPHPTQKPEKLLAKLILASSIPGDLVFDPFGGSGTTAVVAAKLGRRYLVVEQETEYAALTVARLDRACTEPRIQGYDDGVFYERNHPAARRAGEARS